VTPAHHSPEPRWRILVFVVVVIAGVAVAVTTRGTPPPAAGSATPAALVGAPDAESSAWYCTGQSTASGASPGFVILTNTSARSVGANIVTVTDGGATQHTAVAVPPHGVAAPAIPPPTAGSWEAQTVTVDGGGVAVTQAVHSSSGWSESPCLSTTASRWYFPGGTTASGDILFLSLLNPTATPVVVDVTFVTPSGVLHPINFQGIVVPAGSVLVDDVASVVQDFSTVSTIVAARSGRVVASQIQVFGGGSSGLSVVPGVATPQSRWTVSQAKEASGGTSAIDVFNPNPTPEPVTVHLRLPSGPLAPISHTVAPGSTWALATSAQTRIPAGADYSADVVADRGPGVVVGRTVVLPGAATWPQAGMALAIDGLSQASPTDTWVIPPPGTSASPAVNGVAPDSLTLTNTSSGTERYTAYAVTASGRSLLASGALGAGTSAFVSGSILSASTTAQVIVQSTGPMAVSEDAGPAGGVGVVAMPGLPLAASIGL
jgi:uncharacterized protein DUF5719